MCFKIVKYLVDLDASAFFHINLSPYSTRGNSIKLSTVSTPRHNFRSNFFSVRIINIWNSLPDTVVTSSSELLFKSRLCTVNLAPFCRCFPFFYWAVYKCIYMCHYWPLCILCAHKLSLSLSLSLAVTAISSISQYCVIQLPIPSQIRASRVSLSPSNGLVEGGVFFSCH